jgi:outer membrane protein
LAGASNASIKQTNLAADAAKKSLDIVQDSYSQGLISIVELLDAQNATLIAQQMAANSVYDFLIDLMEVERVYGRFNFFSTKQRRAEFFNKAKVYLSKEGVPL